MLRVTNQFHTRSLILASLASESSYVKHILWGEDVRSLLNAPDSWL